MAQCQWCKKEFVSLTQHGYCKPCEKKIREDITINKERLDELLSQAMHCTSQQNKDRIAKDAEHSFEILQEYKNQGVLFFKSDISELKAKFAAVMEDSLNVQALTMENEPAKPPLRSDTLNGFVIIFAILGIFGSFVVWLVYGFVLAISCFVGMLIFALFGKFCATVLFYLEKQRNFNKRTTELLESMSSQSGANSSQQPTKVSTAE